MNENILTAIKDCRIFSGSDEICRFVAEKYSNETAIFSRGEVIFSAEKFHKSLGIILSGNARVERCGADGRNIGMSILSRGDMFGMAVLFNGTQRFDSLITAKNSCSVLYIPEDGLREIFIRYPDVSVAYVEFLSSRIEYLSERLCVLSQPAPGDRLQKYLEALPVDEEGEITLPMSLSKLALFLNIGRATLYRMLGDDGECDFAFAENGKVRRRNL